MFAWHWGKVIKTITINLGLGFIVIGGGLFQFSQKTKLLSLKFNCQELKITHPTNNHKHNSTLHMPEVLHTFSPCHVSRISPKKLSAFKTLHNYKLPIPCNLQTKIYEFSFFIFLLEVGRRLGIMWSVNNLKY